MHYKEIHFSEFHFQDAAKNFLCSKPTQLNQMHYQLIAFNSDLQSFTVSKRSITAESSQHLLQKGNGFILWEHVHHYWINNWPDLALYEEESQMLLPMSCTVVTMQNTSGWPLKLIYHLKKKPLLSRWVLDMVKHSQGHLKINWDFIQLIMSGKTERYWLDFCH